MLYRSIEKLKTVSLWHLVWVTVIMVEILTFIMNTINGYLWWGIWSPDLMKIGTVDAFVVGVIAASFVVFIIDRLRRSEKAAENEVRELNRELERRVAVRTTELSASEEKYRMILEQATDAIAITGQDRRLLMVNARACEMSGYTRDELLNMRVDDFLTPEGIVVLAGDFDKMRAGKTLLSEYQARRKDGTVFTAEVGSTMLADGTVHAIVRDVTARKEADEALRESEEKFRKLVEGSLAGVYILQDGAIVYSNPELERIFGYAPGEFHGKNIMELIHPEDRGLAMASMARIMSGLSSTAKAQLRAFRVDGGQIDIEVIGAATVYGGKPSLIGMLQDISDLKSAEREKELMQQQVLKAQKMEAVGRLAGGIAHDFNNLLTVIRGDCELALAEVNRNDPVRFSLNQIQKASTRASELTRKLMLFGRQKPMAPVRLDLNNLVADMLQMLDRLIGEDIAATIETEPGLMSVYADKAGIEQVIMNLVLNARDAMPDGGTLTIRTENAEGLARPGAFVRFSVTDTGTGIDQEAMPYIFDPFYTGKEIGKGTGLGLSTAYGIVEQHGGWITVESEPGKGSTFSVYLEAGELAGDGEAEPTMAYAESLGAGAATEPIFAGARILLVEDEDIVSSFVSRTLRKNGYKVMSAPGAEEALKLFEREKGEFNLVFTDVVLPDMSGIQLVERLHNIKPGLPVLVTSGYADSKSQWPVIQERGYRFLEKPYDLPDLLNAVREAM